MVCLETLLCHIYSHKYSCMIVNAIQKHLKNTSLHQHCFEYRMYSTLFFWYFCIDVVCNSYVLYTRTNDHRRSFVQNVVWLYLMQCKPFLIFFVS